MLDQLEILGLTLATIIVVDEREHRMAWVAMN